MSAAIREATAADAPTLARLHGLCFEECWDAEAFRRLLENSSAFALLAGSGDTANDSQAFIVIQSAADESEILSLGTAPAARRTGLAQILLKHAGEKAAQKGARAMFLEVAEDNEPALALYRASGFAEAGRRKAYYRRKDGAAADALLLRAALPL